MQMSVDHPADEYPIKTDVLVWLVPSGALLCLLPGVSSVTALVAGVALGLAGGNTRPAKTHRAAQVMLQISVIGLGAGMNLQTILRAGLDGLVFTAISISATLTLGLWLGKKLGVSRDLSLLISGGTAICGGSAIAALSGALRPKPHDTAIALAVIFLLNGVALLVFPPAGHLLGLTQTQFGWWAALGIHDTSSVTGAGLAYGSEALALATVIKLARALWIVPFVIVVARFFKSRPDSEGKKPRLLFPWFIAGFIGLAALCTWVPAMAAITPALKISSQRLLVVTLFLIGTGFSRPALRAVGMKTLILAVTLWFFAAGGALAAILLGLG